MKANLFVPTKQVLEVCPVCIGSCSHIYSQLQQLKVWFSGLIAALHPWQGLTFVIHRRISEQSAGQFIF